MAGLVRATPEELRRVAGATRTDNGELEAAFAAINTELAAFHDFFQGRAAEAFGSTLRSWFDGAKAIKASLDGLAEYLDGAAQAIEAADRGLSDALGGSGGGGSGGSGGGGGGGAPAPMPPSPVTPLPTPGGPVHGQEPPIDWMPEPVRPLPVDPWVPDPIVITDPKPGDPIQDPGPGPIVGDFDGDGDDDVMFPGPYDPGQGPIQGDIDGDGDPDIFVPTPIDQVPHNPDPGTIEPDFIWTDIDGDGDLDKNHLARPFVEADSLEWNGSVQVAPTERVELQLEHQREFLERRVQWAREQIASLEGLDADFTQHRIHLADTGAPTTQVEALRQRVHLNNQALDEARQTLARLHERQAGLAQRIQERAAQSVVQMS